MREVLWLASCSLRLACTFAREGPGTLDKEIRLPCCGQLAGWQGSTCWVGSVARGGLLR